MRCYLRLSSTTPSSSPSLAKICYVRKYTDILHPYTSLPPFLPLPSFDRDFRPSRARQQRRRRRRPFSLQRFASPTSGPPSLSQVLLRVSVARFHESFHAFPSHLGDGDGSFLFLDPLAPLDRSLRSAIESTPLGVRAPSGLDHLPLLFEEKLETRCPPRTSRLLQCYHHPFTNLLPPLAPFFHLLPPPSPSLSYEYSGRRSLASRSRSHIYYIPLRFVLYLRERGKVFFKRVLFPDPFLIQSQWEPWEPWSPFVRRPVFTRLV